MMDKSKKLQYAQPTANQRSSNGKLVAEYLAWAYTRVVSSKYSVLYLATKTEVALSSMEGDL